MSRIPIKRRRSLPLPLLDPLAKLYDVHSLIYQHFSAENVITATKVSKSWNQEIGKSSVCMSKIQLSFEPKSVNEPSPAAVDAILKSSRQYKNLNFNCHYPGLNVLTKFAKSVESLSLQSISFEVPMEPVEFPKLNSLELSDEIPSRVVDRIFRGIQNSDITKLSFHTDLTEPMIQYFHNHSSITELTFNRQLRPMFETANIEAMNRLKITKAFLMNNFYAEASEEVTNNIKNFIRLQKETLTHIVLNMNRREMVKTAMKFPKLKILEIPYLLSIVTHGIPDNTSVEGAYFFLRLGDSEALLQKLPNLKVLQWNFYNDIEDDLEVIVSTCQNLRKLYFSVATDDVHEGDVYDVYDGMIAGNVDEEYNTDIELIHVPIGFKLDLKMLEF